MKSLHFEEIDSTSSYLKKEYANLDNMTFVSADYQTNGRGRMGRNWTASKGENLLFSLLIKDEQMISHFKELSVITAYSVISALKTFKIPNLEIKWPNDVYANGHKICGILLESLSNNDGIYALVIGVGLNVNQLVFDNEAMNYQASSMQLEVNESFDIEKVKTKVYSKIVSNFNKVVKGYNFYPQICQLDYLKNKDAYSIINNVESMIHINGINEDYSLSINLNNEDMNIDSGEITFHLKK